MTLEEALAEALAEQVITIADNTQPVCEAVKGAKVDVSGAVVSVGDVSSVEHPVGVRLTSKNLFNLQGRKVVNFGEIPNTTKRVFQGGKGIILGFARTNYCFNNTTAPYTITDNSVSYTCLDGWYGIGFDIKLLPDTTYVTSVSSRTGGIYLTEYDAEGNYIQVQGLLNSDNSTIAITTSPTTDWGVVSVCSDKGTTVGFTDLQLELGTTATPYAPYMDNFAGGKSKNLVDKENVDVKEWQITQTSATAFSIVENTAGRSFYIPCQPNTTYTMSKKVGGICTLAWTSEEPSVGMDVTGNVASGGGGATSVTLTTGENAAYLVAYFYHSMVDSATTVEEWVASIQIELGETATPYEPYYDLPQVQLKRQGANFFQTGNLEDYVGAKVHNLQLGQGSLTQGSYHSASSHNCNPQIKYAPGTYTIAANVTEGASKRIYIKAYAADGTTLTGDTVTIYKNASTAQLSYYTSYGGSWIGILSDTTSQLIITVPDNVAYWCLGFVFYYSNNDLNALANRITFSNIQVVKGTALPEEYEEYQEPRTYTANADGTVDGVRSLSPSMVLTTDNEGAVINARYFPESARGMQIAYGNLVQEETKLRDSVREGVV